MSFTIQAQRAISDSKALPPAPTISTPQNIVVASGTGALLHLDASVGVTVDANNKVSAWADQSGNGNNFNQLTSTNQPTLVVDANGNQAVHFDLSTYAASMNGTAFDVRDKTIMFVLNHNANSGIVLLDYYYSNGLTFYDNLSGSMYIRTTATSYTSVPANGVNNYVVVINRGVIGSNSVTRYSNGNVVNTTSTSDNSNLVKIDKLAGISSASYVNYDVYEVAVFDKILNQTEINNVNTYIANKYGMVL